VSLLERLKWWVAPKEMEELHRWRSQWEEHRRWLAEFEHTSATLDHMRSWVDGTPLIEMKSISRFREELRSKMNTDLLEKENEQLKAALKADNATAWAQAHRLALELECLLLDTKDNAIVSKWWDSGMAALNEYQQLKPGAKEDAEAWAKMRKETL